MSETPQFLAEGAYGCVHRPSLHCNTSKKINYKNKISKIMTTKNATKELREYVLIDRVDPTANYYSGKPENCKFEKNSINNPAVEKCKMGKNISESSDNYELIIMYDGGDNLKEFADKMKKATDNVANRQIMTEFWSEAKRLFRGVNVFIENNLIHHDLKPQNIVYNSLTNRCNFIDFGMMEDITRSKYDANRNAYRFDYYNWNFPTESIFLNAAEFLHYSELLTSEKMEYCSKMFPKNVKQAVIFYEYTMKNTRDEQLDHFKEWSNYFLYAIGRTTYEQFLDRCFETYDIYGLGISLLHVLENTKHLIHENKYLKLQHLFNLMMSPNMADRVGIEEAIHIYDDILSSTYAELESEKNSEIELEKNINDIIKNIKQIPDMDIIADMTPSPRTPTKTKSPKTHPVTKLHSELAVLGGRSPLCGGLLSSNKKCPEGSFFNPKTKRCNKNKTQKVKSPKKCPEGSFLNPKTKRCNKIK